MRIVDLLGEIAVVGVSGGEHRSSGPSCTPGRPYLRAERFSRFVEGGAGQAAPTEADSGRGLAAVSDALCHLLSPGHLWSPS